MNKSQQKRNTRFYADVFAKKIRDVFDNVKANNKKYKTILIEFQDALKEMAKFGASSKEEFWNWVNNCGDNDDRIVIYSVDVVFEYFVDVIRQVWREAYLLDEKNKGKVEIQKNLLRLDSICMGVAGEMIANEVPLDEAANPYKSDLNEDNEDSDESEEDIESANDVEQEDTDDESSESEEQSVERSEEPSEEQDVNRRVESSVERSEERSEEPSEEQDVNPSEEKDVNRSEEPDVTHDYKEDAYGDSDIQKDLESDYDNDSSSMSSLEEVVAPPPIKTVNVSEYESSSESEIEQEHSDSDESSSVEICSDSDTGNDPLNLDKDIKVVTINQKLVKQKKHIKKKLLETTKDKRSKEREHDHHKAHKTRHSHSFF